MASPLTSHLLPCVSDGTNVPSSPQHISFNSGDINVSSKTQSMSSTSSSSIEISTVAEICLEVVLPMSHPNHHPMQMRSKIDRSKPKAFHNTPKLLVAPKYFKDVVGVPGWMDAMSMQFCLKMVHGIIGSLWVYKTKDKSNVTLDKYKANLIT